MAGVQLVSTQEVRAQDGWSAVLEFSCPWSERLVVEGVPGFGAAYSEAGFGTVRRKVYRKVPAAKAEDDLCHIRVEYSTPRPTSEGGGPDEPLPAKPWETPPTLLERKHTATDIIIVAGFESTSLENYLQREIEMPVSHLVYTRALAFEDDQSDHFLEYLDTINDAEVEDLGNNLEFGGDAKQLLLAGFEVEAQYRNVDDAMELVIVHTLTLKKRRIPWSYIWVNPEPWRSESGSTVIYGEAKPFIADGVQHKRGDVVMRPCKLVDDNYQLNLDAIGWQEVLNKTPDPLTGETYEDTGIHEYKDWSGILQGGS